MFVSVTKNRAGAAALALVCVAGGAPATAQEPEDPRWAQEWAINGVLISGWILFDYFKADLAPEQCRWCDSTNGEWDPPGPDRWARNVFLARDTSAADTASDVLGYWVLPAASFGVVAASRNGDWEGAASDATLMTRGIASAIMVNQLVKFSAGRARPFTHVEPVPFSENPDQNLSFFSGHTTLAFSSVVSAGLVLRRADSPAAPWAFAIGVPVAVAVGLLRISADKHYLTDVVAGAIIGSVVPWVAIDVIPYSGE